MSIFDSVRTKVRIEFQIGYKLNHNFTLVVCGDGLNPKQALKETYELAKQYLYQYGLTSDTNLEDDLILALELSPRVANRLWRNGICTASDLLNFDLDTLEKREPVDFEAHQKLRDLGPKARAEIRLWQEQQKIVVAERIVKGEA